MSLCNYQVCNRRKVLGIEFDFIISLYYLIFYL